MTQLELFAPMPRTERRLLAARIEEPIVVGDPREVAIDKLWGATRDPGEHGKWNEDPHVWPGDEVVESPLLTGVKVASVRVFGRLRCVDGGRVLVK